jgi:hypothetical protein
VQVENPVVTHSLSLDILVSRDLSAYHVTPWFHSLLSNSNLYRYGEVRRADVWTVRYVCPSADEVVLELRVGSSVGL